MGAPVGRLPRAGALAGAAARLTGVPAAAVAVRAHPGVDAGAASTLLRACVAARLVWHPSLVALVEAAGGRRESQVAWSLPAGAPGWVDLLARVHPQVWHHPDQAASPGQVAALVGVAAPPVGAAGPTGPGRVVVSRSGRRVTMRLECPPLRVGPQVTVTTGRSALVTPDRLEAVVGAGRRAGLVVVDADAPGRLADLGWLADRRLVARPAPGAPGWAVVDTGPLVTGSTAPVVPAPDAAVAVGRAGGNVAAAADPLVVAASRVARAGACTFAPPGVVLHAWQESFVGAYLAGGPGLVNALPPGTGKTACVAVAMAAVAAGQGPPVREAALGHRGVVVVPVTLVDQWTRELGVFHPAARVVVATDAGQVAAAVRAWARPGPLVVVVTPQVLAGHAGAVAGWCPDDLAVDEATYLRGRSAAAAAVWALRGRAVRAAVLSGTPDERGPGSVAALVGFATGRAEVAAAAVDAHLAGVGELERAGVFAFTRPASGAGLPGTGRTVVQVPPGPVEQVVEQVARERVAALLAGARTDAARRRLAARLRTEVDRWRVGLACPAALLVGSSQLAGQVGAALVRAGLLPGAVTGDLVGRVVARWPHLSGAKVAHAAGWVAGGDGPALVFTDSPDAAQALVAAVGDRARCAVVSGRVRPAARARLVERFGAGQVDVLVVCAAGQHGLNLQAARRLLHLDVPASGQQAAQRDARAVRLGAVHDLVEVQVPVLEGTGEQVWWAHACGARAGVDVLTLAGELTG